MKLTNEEVNYSASVVRIHNFNDLEGADRLVGFSCFGMQAIVAKGSYEVGQLGILFPTECQLSLDFATKNNLHAHSELNEDKEAKGYLGDKRRVQAIKLRGNKSTALFMPLSSLEYLGINTNELKEGDSFTHINGIEICRKYVIVRNEPGQKNKTKGTTKKFKRIDNKIFPEHWDTDSFFRNVGQYKENDELIVTQKLHGTSARFTNQLVLRKPTWKDKVAKFFGVQVQEYGYDTVAGSRRVIKDVKAETNHEHFYSADVWNRWLEKVQHVIPKNWVLYGEIVGYTEDGGQIQKNYNYDCPVGTSQLYIYRVTIVNPDGIVLDLSWKQIKDFCVNNGLKHVPELWSGKFSEFNVDDWMDRDYHNTGYPQAIPLDKNSPCDEGVCIRREGFSPYVTKAKAPEFLLHETNQLNKGEIDTESQEG